MLDASSAFDLLSWTRIYHQFLKRDIPKCLIKLLMIQLFSNRISICSTTVFFARCGVKQGGILSGRIFSACYDDLVNLLSAVGAGVLTDGIETSLILVFIIVYVDDIILFAQSPFGLKRLIEQTLIFANAYHDLSFNPSKSCILRAAPSSCICMWYTRFNLSNLSRGRDWSFCRPPESGCL